MIYIDAEGMFSNHPDAFLSDDVNHRWAFRVGENNEYWLDHRAGWNKRSDMPIKRTEAEALIWVEQGIVNRHYR